MNKSVLMLAAMLILTAGAACGGKATPQPVCGPEFCVRAMRLIRVDQNTLSLVLETAPPDGSLNAAEPPLFAGGLHVMLADEGGDRRLVDSAFGPERWSCIAGDNIPGAEGRLTTACLLVLSNNEIAAMPSAGVTVTLGLYGDTFPLLLTDLTMP